jgi:prephenate dehydratase
MASPKNAEIVPFYNTAGAVKMIKEKKLKHARAITSERAGKIYKMKILKKGIENNSQNYTRFLVRQPQLQQHLQKLLQQQLLLQQRHNSDLLIC